MKSLSWGLLSSVMGIAIANAGVGDIALLRQNQNNAYEVVCSNGFYESVTDLDLELSNVCPRKVATGSYRILVMQKREDGKFDVMCQDFRRFVATHQEIVLGKLCSGPNPRAE